MNQREFTALGAAELDPMAVVLYVRAFRRYMDFKTGESALSLSRLAQELEYQPPACSRRGKVESVSTKRVRTLITHLVDAGLLVLVRPGNAARKAPAVYRCELATTDQKRSNSPSLTQIRPNEEGHIADTVQGHIDGHSKTPENKGLESKQGHIDGHSQNFNEGHISERSELNTRERTRASENDQFLTGRDIALTNEMRAIFFRRFGTDENRLENEFTSFQLHKSNKSTMRSLRDWYDEWRRWIARSKIMNPSSSVKTTGGQTYAQRKRNNSSELLNVSRQYLEEAEGHGYDGDDD